MENTVKRKVNDRVVAEMHRAMGGNRFLSMTGSKPKYKSVEDGMDSVMYGLRRNGSKANFLRVSYNGGLDLYEMKFIKFTDSMDSPETVSEHTGLYGDMLESTFTEVTGLNTRL